MNRSIEEGEPVVITRSWRPSPLKSPTVREFGSGPAAKWAAGPNVPSPRPRRTDTSPDTAFAETRQDGQITSEAIRYDQVLAPVFVEIASRDRGGCLPDGKMFWLTKGPIAVAKQDGHVPVGHRRTRRTGQQRTECIGVGHRQILKPVTVEITHDDRRRSEPEHACLKRSWRIKRSVVPP